MRKTDGETHGKGERDFEVLREQSLDSTSSSPTHGRRPGIGMDIGEFVRGMAHEIANPFNAISMNVELVKYLLERNQTARAREVLDRLMAECVRCGRLLQGMQRFGSALHAQERTVLDLRQQIDSAIDLAQEEIGDKQAAIVVTQADSDIKIFADAPALECALTGLLHNAVEAGARKVQIDIRVDVDQAVIEFGDDGSGIPEDIRPRVTEPFFSTRRREGSCGLGLTLVRDLAAQHGGSLTIAADQVQGALVSLRLPLWVPREGPDPAIRFTIHPAKS